MSTRARPVLLAVCHPYCGQLNRHKDLTRVMMEIMRMCSSPPPMRPQAKLAAHAWPSWRPRGVQHMTVPAWPQPQLPSSCAAHRPAHDACGTCQLPPICAGRRSSAACVAAHGVAAACRRLVCGSPQGASACRRQGITWRKFVKRCSRFAHDLLHAGLVAW